MVPAGGPEAVVPAGGPEAGNLLAFATSVGAHCVAGLALRGVVKDVRLAAVALEHTPVVAGCLLGFSSAHHHSQVVALGL